MNDLSRYDLDWCVRRLPPSIVAAFQARPGAYVVAGGFVRDTIAGIEVKDIDIFARNLNDARDLADKLSSKGKRFTDNACTFLVDDVITQVIYKWTFDGMAEILAHFDFTIARAAIRWDNDRWSSACDPHFYQDLAAKRLIYTKPSDPEPGSSLLRLLKFAERGYRIPLDHLAYLTAATVHQVENTAHGSIEETASRVARKLFEVDPQTTRSELLGFTGPDGPDEPEPTPESHPDDFPGDLEF